MKILHHERPVCDCQQRLSDLEAVMAKRGQPLAVGSIVECDCGTQYMLSDGQRAGVSWRWYDPNSGDMSLR